MSIRFTKYVNITSVVGAQAQVPERQWCARIFTTDPRVGPNAVLQFSGNGGNIISGVGQFFGTASEEYARAQAYASYLSPLGTAPVALQFARYVSAAQPATIYGEASIAVLATLKAITAGLLSFKFGATQVNLTGITFAAATSLTDVASELQTAIRAGAGAPNGELTNAVVTWNATAQAFDFSASPTGVVTETFQVVAPAGVVPATDVAAALGWYASQGALVNDAQIVETPDAGFSRVVNLDNNFGEFVYTDVAALTLAQVTAIAILNAAFNVMFIFRVPVTPTDWATWQAALIGIAGVGLEYEDVGVTGARQYVEMLPMSIHAAIDFAALNGTVGFMFKQNGLLTPSVSTDTLSDTLDAARVNYYGVTQQAGRKIAFYQEGVLCGGATAPVDSTVFANEQWFKDDAGANLMNLQLSVGQIPANKRGQTMCDNVLQDSITDALNNGTISANSTLTIQQQTYITQQTGDATAWQQVQNIGWWKGSAIVGTLQTNGVTKYAYKYTIIYRKDDVVKEIDGSHQLI